MQANAYSSYVLRDLHQTIDLMDRKIAYSTTLESFQSEEDREACLRKLSSKRAALVKTALALAALGVRCDPRFLPRSFLHLVEDQAGSAASVPLAAEEKSTQKLARPRQKRG